jgi:hypothetical protein
MTALQHLSPKVLRDLASAIEARQGPDRLAACDLTDRGVEKLLEILASGSSPTIGFWKRYRRPTDA